ncbi:phosphomannomutase [Devosia neptuniae]|uniref:phosphomannomutase n=1 Tax=Devosia neptuniae TaxID=191302 RepID=UPI0022AEA2D5|nr:phosphomannomutase [Devosia neptuniae]MCZ4347995.1 phosphomannomutase [Devosia neptuniae]|tara:strand:+ start:739 stop:2151 length:1413 start_codon:yes stop_codon:yes gene_type:complete
MTSLKFGTSGLRGLAVELVGDETRRYTAAFLRYLSSVGESAAAIYLGRDLRASSEAIYHDCAAAAAAMGLRVVNCGVLAAPALACHAMAADAPSIMITGSHIPADRNGLKFSRASREISKLDEIGIIEQLGEVEGGDYKAEVVNETIQAAALYIDRYRGVIAEDAIKGWRTGVYEHSTAGRGTLAAVFAASCAEIVPLGRSDDFFAVYTQAFTDSVSAPLPQWLRAHRLDAIISADGDADRPLLMDDLGQFVRGDVLGLLAAQFFGADAVVTPVTSKTAIEATRYFPSVVRTKVGSPYVIEGIDKARAAGAHCVFGFEANGGTLLGSDLVVGSSQLSALMTRDAILPLIGVFGRAAAENCAISDLVEALPLRVALSDRLENIVPEKSRAVSERLSAPPAAAAYFGERGSILRTIAIDGLQVFVDDGTMIHYRASGNAPELRCYVEADTPARAQDALSWGLNAARMATVHA